MSKLCPVLVCIGACPSHGTLRAFREIKELLVGNVQVIKLLARGYMLEGTCMWSHKL